MAPFDSGAKWLLDEFREPQRIRPSMICIDALNRYADLRNKFVAAIGALAFIDLRMRYVPQLFEGASLLERGDMRDPDEIIPIGKPRRAERSSRTRVKKIRRVEQVELFCPVFNGWRFGNRCRLAIFSMFEMVRPLLDNRQRRIDEGNRVPLESFV
ncbi:MAG: hypothetical protein M3Z22_04345 [Verrucomicrobiota bacterium]|nr:hypothetical protein [Verrucomicrobiota bacterium]